MVTGQTLGRGLLSIEMRTDVKSQHLSLGLCPGSQPYTGARVNCKGGKHLFTRLKEST